MAKIIVAFAEEQQRERIAGALEEAGMPVFRRCSSGAEVVRAMHILQDGVLICAARLPDCTADELAQDLDALALMLIIGRREVLALCETRNAFKLAFPITRDALASAVRMLLQLHDMRMPRRSENERAIICQAKQLLMDSHGMDEAQAHHALQRISMKHGIKMVESARRLLRGEDLFGGDPWNLTH